MKQKTASVGVEIFRQAVDPRKFSKIKSRLKKSGDNQSYALMNEIMRHFMNKFDMDNMEESAWYRLLNMVRDGDRWDESLLRNNVFKIADALRMKLPSGIFASDNLRSELTKLAQDVPAMRKHILPLLKKTARGGMERGADNIQSHLWEAHQAMKSLSGLFYYRLRGEGSVNDLTRERMLDDKQKREAEGADKELESLKKSLDSLMRDVSKFQKKMKSLDGFMQFT